MGEWKRVPLAEVVKLKRGFDLPEPDRRPGPYPVVGSAGVSGWHDEGPIAGPGVTVGRSGASIGVATYVSGSYWPLNTTLFVEDFLGNDPRFVYYLLDSLDFQRFNSGSAQPSLNRNYIAGITVAIPDVNEQRAIAAVLGALDDKIAVNEQIMTTSHELAQALAARVLADSPRVPLAEIATITMGSSPPGHTYNDAGIGMPFYQGARDFGSRFPKRRVWCTEPVRLAQPGSTLVSVRAPVGRLNVAIEQCCIGQGLAALTSKNQTPSVLFHTLSFASEIWQPFESEGTVFGAINKAQLEGLLVPALDPPSCHELEATLSSLDDLARQRFMENATLAELRDTLLPKLMSGELRVRDAEKAVEESARLEKVVREQLERIVG